MQTYPLPLAWAGLCGLIVLAALRWRLKSRPLPTSPLNVPIGLLATGSAVGLYTSLRPETFLAYVFGLLGAIGTYFLVIDLVATAEAARVVAQQVLVAVIVAVFGLFVVIAPDLEFDRMLVRLPDKLEAVFMAPEPLLETLENIDGINHRFRLHSSGLGALAAYGAGLALGPLLANGGRTSRLLAGLALGYFGIFLVLASNRGDLLSAALVILLLGATRYRWLAGGLVLLVVLASWNILRLPHPGLIVGLPQSVPLLPAWATAPDTVYQRLEIWQNVLFLLSDFRFTGIDSAVQLYNAYFLPHRYPYYHAHSAFLQTYLTLGLPGLIGLASLVVITLKVGWRNLRIREPVARSAAISGMGGALAFLLTGVTNIALISTLGLLLLFAALGLLVAVDRLERSSHERLPGRRAATPSMKVFRPSTVALAAVLVVTTSALALASTTQASLRVLLTQTARTAVAEWYLNLGALELAKATWAGRQTREQREQRLGSAKYFLDRAGEIDPGHLGVLRNLAGVAIVRSEAEAALRVLSEAEQLAAPDDSRLFFQLGRLYREAGSVEQAVSAWSRVDPKIGIWNGAGPDAQLMLWGQELVRRGQWRRAVQVNLAAVHAAPIRSEPYDALALSASRHQGEEASLATIQGLAETYPDIPWPYQKVGELHQLAGRTEEAVLWRQRARAVLNSDAWRARRQLIWAEGGNPARTSPRRKPADNPRISAAVRR